MDRFENNILLKLRRKYSKEEAVKLLSDKIDQLENELKQTKFKNGELLSENAELKHVIKVMKQNKQDLKKDGHIIELNKCIKTIRESNKKLTKDVDTWRNKFFNLEAKNNKQ